MKSTGNNVRLFLLVAFAVAALLVGTPAYAQDKTGEIDKIFSWATPAAPGCVVAVSQRGKLVVNRAYGSADLERDVPLSPGSIFDIASVRKQFVAAAVLLLAKDGKLSLSDDIRGRLTGFRGPVRKRRGRLCLQGRGRTRQPGVPPGGFGG